MTPPIILRRQFTPPLPQSPENAFSNFGLFQYFAIAAYN